MDVGGVESNSSLIDRFNLRWVLRLLTSSIGRKFVIGFTGLSLCGFLVVHLAGNLLLYAGPEHFNEYAIGLHKQEWLPLAEAGLFLMFLLHIAMATAITLENQQKRGVGYARKESKIEGKVFNTPPSNWMFVTGAIVLGFLILHITDMKLEARPDVAYSTEHEVAPYHNTTSVLGTGLSQAVYLVGTFFLGIHLSHGFSSAFQSLGLTHPKYTPLIKVIGVIFAVVIAAGFFSLPLSALFNILPAR